MADPIQCDFCNEWGAVWKYPVDDFTQLIDKPTITIEWMSVGAWFACITCHQMIQANTLETLARRALNAFASDYNVPGEERERLIDKIKILHEEFMAMRSGEAVHI